jgi:hypothetical protein
MKLPNYISCSMAQFGVSDWTAEPGSKHIKIKIAGRMVGVVRRGESRDSGGSGREEIVLFKRNIRRILRELGRI